METEDGPEVQLLRDERKKAVQAAVSTLPQDMQDAVHLVYFEELSYEDAAKIMKKNRKQIDNLLQRSKQKLRSILGEEGALL